MKKGVREGSKLANDKESSGEKEKKKEPLMSIVTNKKTHSMGGKRPPD
jgi:hypothetical protein